MARYDMIQRV